MNVTFAIVVAASLAIGYSTVSTTTSSNVPVGTQFATTHNAPAAGAGVSQLWQAQPRLVEYKALVNQNEVDSHDMAQGEYPRWLLTAFPVSLAAVAVGLLSLIYIALAGLSLVALACTYLLPFGLVATYYLLGVAERSAGR